MTGESTKRPTGMPRWVTGFVWAGVAAVVLVGIMLASGHGPWQHLHVAGMQNMNGMH